MGQAWRPAPRPSRFDRNGLLLNSVDLKPLPSRIPLPGADKLSRAALAFAFLASAGGLVSIAFSHACLGASLVLLAASNTEVRFPPIKAPLFAFLGLTVVSLLASDAPWEGLPQIKKFFVFAFLPVVYSLLARRHEAHRLLQAWFVVAGLTAAVSIVQFVYKWQTARAAGEDFYSSYIGNRISGSFSHWMTFSEVGLLVFVVLAAYLLFSPQGRKKTRVFWVGGGVLMGASLLLSFTRSVWLALLVCSLYLIWNRKRKLLWFVPLLFVILAALSPDAARQRIASINPGANPARLLMWETGWNMVKAHPWLGVGPERVGPRFEEFMPEWEGELPDAYYGHLHNVYIHYAAERGVPAALALLWLLFRVLGDCRGALMRVPRGRDDDRFLLHATMAATLAVMIVGCFDLTLGDSEILAVYLAIVALGYGAVSRAASRGSVL